MATPNVSAPDKQEILRQEEELERKNKWLYPTVIGILIVFFVVGFVYGLQSVLSMEGSFPPVELTESKTDVPKSNEELVAYLNAVSAKAVAEKPAVSTDWSFWVDADSISVPSGGTFADTLKYLADPLEDYMEDCVEDQSADFSEGIEHIFVAPEFSTQDIDSFSCDYIYYKCHSCGEESAEPLDHCEACGSEYPYQMQYRDDYTFTIDVRPADALLEKYFTPDYETIENMIAPQLKNVLSLSDIQTRIERLYLTVVIRRSNDELLSVRYGKDVSASAEAKFEGDYASLGETVIGSLLSDRMDYDFTWPALNLNAHSKVLEPKATDNLLATLVCSDPTAYDAVWTSSDESVVEVDSDGYLKAGKNPGSAIITASYDFNGKSFSDSCEIIVRIPVESIKLNRRHLTLGVGETYELTATVSPKKATVRTATFYSTDESVAVVTEEGAVTAVAPGVVTVYALSDDGYFRSSCEVTVK